MGDPWFKVERTGWAAQPCSWKGWGALAVYSIALVAWAVIVFALMGPTPTNIAIFIVVSLGLTVVLVAVALKKSEGTWAWQRRSQPGGK